MWSTRSLQTSASGERLEKLIRERTSPGANKAEIDARIWDLFGEEWAVIFTDLSGFSRAVQEFGIIHFLQTIYESVRVLSPVIDANDGILLKSEGDSMMLLFRQAERAIDCAIAMQRTLKEYNAGRPKTEQVLLCVGIGFGRVLRIGDEDVFGAEVNAASKLGEDTAKAWEILVTGPVQRKVGSYPGVTFESIDYVPPGTDSAFKLSYTL